MCTVIRTHKKPYKSSEEKLWHRFRFAKASLAIEGLELTPEENDFFESLVRENRSFEEMRKALDERFPTP